MAHRIEKANWWKVVGLAGLFGVAATGAWVARQERQRNTYSPDEIRDRLRSRLAQVEAEEIPSPPPR